jgi:hypothetical protein
MLPIEIARWERTVVDETRFPEAVRVRTRDLNRTIFVPSDLQDLVRVPEVIETLPHAQRGRVTRRVSASCLRRRGARKRLVDLAL